MPSPSSTQRTLVIVKQVYQALPASTTRRGHNLLTTNISVEIELPAGVVYEYIADMTNNPTWQFGVESTEWTSGQPGGVGSTYDQTMEYRGQVTSYTVTAIDPGRSITVESQTGATISTTVTRTVEMLNENRCRVRAEVKGELPGWRKLTKPLAGRMIRRSLESDYRRLKRQLETPAEEEQ